MTSKQRAYLKGLAMTIDPIFQLGKNSLTPENTKAIAEALEARELIKINVLETSPEEIFDVANSIAKATNSEVVQTVGNKITIFRARKKNSKIELPK